MSPNPVSPGKAKMRTKAVVFSFLAALLLVLASCGQSGTGRIAAKSRILTVIPSPNGDFTEAFSPYNSNASYGSKGMIYETLLFFNRLDSSIHPWLAQSYQVSADAKSITFHLRQDVTWSDGQPFTANDVAFTLNMLKQYPAADGNALWQTIQSVQTTGKYTVVVNLKMSSSPFLWYLGGQTWIVPQHLWVHVGDPTRYIDAQPVGTGPFTLKSFAPQLIDLVKNPHYWQPGKPEVSEIHYPAFNSNTSAQLVLSQGNVSWTGLFTPNVQQTFVNRNPSTNHYWFPPNNIVTLYLNLAKAPFDQLAVRQAISSAIDRQQLYKVGESNYEPPAHPTGLVLPANKSFLDSTYASTSFSVDTAQATRLMESAGFTKGSDGIYVDQHGKKLAFNLNVVTGWSDWVTDCQLIASELKAIGIDVTVNAISFGAYISALQTGSFDMAISWTNPGPTPYYLFNSMLNSVNTAPIGQNASSNFERWNDSTTDQLLNQIATTTDASIQQQAYNGLQKIMVEQLPTIPLVFGATWNEYSTANFSGWPGASNPYASPAPFDYPDAEIVVLNLKLNT